VTRAAYGVLLVVWVVLFAGCAGSSTTRPPPATATASTAVVTLSASSPTAHFTQAARASATSALLRVQDINNPALQGLDFAVDIASVTDPSNMVTIGNVSLYPADRPAHFTLPLPAAAAALARIGPTELIVTLSPALSGTQLRSVVSLAVAAELA
jgi:hypothetical protein